MATHKFILPESACDNCGKPASEIIASLEEERDAYKKVLTWMASFDTHDLYDNLITTLHIDMAGRAKEVLAIHRAALQVYE